MLKTRSTLIFSALAPLAVLGACGTPSGGSGGPGPDGGPPPDGEPPETDLLVCSSGGDFSEIGEAIEAADDGTVIEVCPGTYYEQLVVAGKSVTLVGRDGAGTTVIDGSNSRRPLEVTDGGLTLHGITARNGSVAEGGGGAIHCRDSSLAIRGGAVASSRAEKGAGLYTLRCEIDIADTWFNNNTAVRFGGGAYLVETTGSFAKNQLDENQARYGGGLATSESAASIADSSFAANRASLQGGALYHASDGAIEGNRFEGNRSGWTAGGIYVEAHGPLISENQIIDSYAENDGGGIYLHKTTAELTDNLFAGNVSNDDGGGIRVFESEMLVARNRVENNYASDSGGGIRVSHLPVVFRDNEVVDNQAGGIGGGFDLDNDSSVITGGIIEGNVAGGVGGGIHAWLFPWNGGLIENVRIAGNEAYRGGGIYMRDNYRSVTLRGLEIVDNVADHGAGIAIRTSPFTLSHSVVSNNESFDEGGGISIGADDREFGQTCGPMESLPCPPTEATGSIRFVVSHDNIADSGGASLWARSPALEVASSIFVSPLEGAVTVVDTAPLWQYNNTSPASFAGMTDPSGTAGNISAAPQFLDPTSYDFALASGSACIDAGDPNYSDLDGTRADMGRHGGLGGLK